MRWAPEHHRWWHPGLLGARLLAREKGRKVGLHAPSRASLSAGVPVPTSLGIP